MRLFVAKIYTLFFFQRNDEYVLVYGLIWSIALVREGSVTTWRVARWVVTTLLFAAIATNNNLNLKQEKQSLNSACSLRIASNKTEPLTS